MAKAKKSWFNIFLSATSQTEHERRQPIVNPKFVPVSYHYFYHERQNSLLQGPNPSFSLITSGELLIPKALPRGNSALKSVSRQQNPFPAHQAQFVFFFHAIEGERKKKFHLTWRLCSSKPRKVESLTERRDLL